jgi:hypothetical protein
MKKDKTVVTMTILLLLPLPLAQQLQQQQTAPHDHCRSLWIWSAKAQQQHQQSHQSAGQQSTGVMAKSAIVEKPAFQDGIYRQRQDKRTIVDGTHRTIVKKKGIVYPTSFQELNL